MLHEVRLIREDPPVMPYGPQVVKPLVVIVVVVVVVVLYFILIFLAFR